MTVLLIFAVVVLSVMLLHAHFNLSDQKTLNEDMRVERDEALQKLRMIQNLCQPDKSGK